MKSLYIILLLAMLTGCSCGGSLSSNDKDSTNYADESVKHPYPVEYYIYLDSMGCVHTSLNCPRLYDMKGGVIFIPIDDLQQSGIRTQSEYLRTGDFGLYAVRYPFYCPRCVNDEIYEAIERRINDK